MHPAARHLTALVAIAAIVGVLYARVSGAWFCGYDDFNEIHRAAFVDARNPAGMLTTTHFDPYMYRPVTSALQYVTWNAFHHSAVAFRLRNLCMHLVCVAMLYGMLFLMTGSRAVASATALLFGIEPLANETVVVAIWTNAFAYALVFTALFLFMYALHRLRSGGRYELPLAVSLIAMFVAIFTYEPAIVGFAFMLLYAAIWSRAGPGLPRAYIIWIVAGIAIELAIFMVARHAVVTDRAPLNSAAIVLRNALMYAIALGLPVDFVMAHRMFGTPLPSEVRLDKALAGALLALAIAIAGLVAYVVRRQDIANIFTPEQRRTMLFLLVSIPIGVIPLLLFREHASEHDLYFSAAWYVALISIVLRRLISERAPYAACVALFAVSFGSAIGVRNSRVEQCAGIAQRIMTQLPVARWQKGTWHIRLANRPGAKLGTPYGIYNDTGLMTLQIQASTIPGAQQAVQIAANNDAVAVDVVDPAQIEQGCAKPGTCFFISPSGKVMPATMPRRSAAMFKR